MKTIIIENHQLFIVEGEVEVEPINDEVKWGYFEDEAIPTFDETTQTLDIVDGKVVVIAKAEDILLQEAKEKKIESLIEYDNSETVNAFALNGSTTWINSKARAILLHRLNSEAERLGADANTNAFASYGIETIAVSRALTIVRNIEIYAAQCWDTTNVVHKRAIENLTTVADLEAYDFTTGYPDKLNINL